MRISDWSSDVCSSDLGRATSLIDNNLALVRKAKESIVGDDSRAASKAGVRLRQPAGRADLRNRLPAQGRSYAVTVHGAHSGNRITAASPAGSHAHGPRVRSRHSAQTERASCREEGWQ